jgi:hypothetical protein
MSMPNKTTGAGQRVAGVAWFAFAVINPHSPDDALISAMFTAIQL